MVETPCCEVRSMNERYEPFSLTKIFTCICSGQAPLIHSDYSELVKDLTVKELGSHDDSSKFIPKNLSILFLKLLIFFSLYNIRGRNHFGVVRAFSYVCATLL